ncbi:MAG: class I SAM-dependent methyltransferase [Leptospirales bacterium]|jgi:tRNA (cmo5U34)-methyltransferase
MPKVGHSRISRGFDLVAPIYDLLAAVGSGNRIPRIRRALLPRLPPREKALVLGDGTGRFLCELMATGRIRRAVCIDASAGMIAKARARWITRSEQLKLDPRSVSFQVAALPLPNGLAGPYDLVCTNFFLDLFIDAELESILLQIDTALAPGAFWYFSDFRYPDAAKQPFANIASRLLVRILYTFFGSLSGLGARRLPDIHSAFHNSGYEPLFESYSTRGILECKIFQKL